MANEISNAEDIIDSRDVIERIEELEGLDSRTKDEQSELEALQKLAKQGEDYADDWQYGETLIRDSYFTEYAEQMADDMGAIDHKAKWPLTHIDWGAAAEELKGDYMAIDFDGVTYWVR